MKPMPLATSRQSLIRVFSCAWLASVLALQACGDDDASLGACLPDGAYEEEADSGRPDGNDASVQDDAGRSDAGQDGSVTDSGTSDSGASDSGGGTADTGAMDAASPDADASTADSAMDGEAAPDADAQAADAASDAAPDAADAQAADASTDAGPSPQEQCGLGSDDSRLLVPSADANDNPRAWTLVLCPRPKVLVGLGSINLGEGVPELMDGVLPRCATPTDLANATLSTNIAIDTLPENRQPNATLTEFSCGTDQIATGIAYAEASGDFLDGVTVICTDKSLSGGSTTVNNPDLTTQLTSLLCPTGHVAIGLAYKDSPTDPNSDGTESVTVVCRPLLCF